MKFNKFIWKNYLSSEGGKKCQEFFHNLEKHYQSESEELFEFVEFWLEGQTLRRFSVESKKADVTDIIFLLKEIKDSIEKGHIDRNDDSKFKDIDSIFESIDALVLDDPDEDGKDVYLAGTVNDIPSLSVALYILYPNLFFPYYFFPNFQFLINIFEEFEIFLPPVPAKRDYEARYFYYLELCKTLHEFFDKHEIEYKNVPIFLYGFAPNVVEGLKIPSDLPEASRAWFVGGAINKNGDFEFLEASTPDTTTFWQGNPSTRAGDIVLMYCLSPHSCNHSIWRAMSDGAFEPFKGFYGNIWIGKRHLIQSITLNELKEDPVMSSMPLVRQNMQGINGRIVEKKYYDRILEVLESKNQNVNDLPRLLDHKIDDVEICNERDVEVHILEPLLARLGIVETRVQRQVSVKVGRSEKVIPDYLISPGFIPRPLGRKIFV